MTTAMLAPAGAALAALASVVEVSVSSRLGDSRDVIGTQSGALGYEAILAGVMVHAAEANRTNEKACNITADVYKALPLIFLAIGIIQGLEMLNGQGPPDSGSKFHARSVNFSNNIAALLAGAAATTGWSGSGAEKYNRLNRSQYDWVMEIAKADQAIADILKIQADEVQLGRELLAGARLVLLGAITVIAALVIEFNQYLGWASAIADNIAAVIICFTVWVIGFAVALALGPILYLCAEGEMHKDKINEEYRKYRDSIMVL